MFGLSDSLAPQTHYHSDPTEYLEPHVESFDIHSRGKRQFIFPFQVITYCVLALVVLGFLTFLLMDDTSLVQVIVWIQVLIAPFYLPGLYYYATYFKQEKHTQVELDPKAQLIKYSHSKEAVNLLFHASQVESCVVNMSLLFPYKVDYLTMKLKGGPEIYISSLVVEPLEILKRFSIEYDIQKRILNPVPRG